VCVRACLRALAGALAGACARVRVCARGCVRMHARACLLACLLACMCVLQNGGTRIMDSLTLQRTAVWIFTALKYRFQSIWIYKWVSDYCVDDTGRYPLPSGGNAFAVNKCNIISYHISFHI